MENELKINKKIIIRVIIGTLIFIAFIIFNPLVIIRAGQQGVVLNFGATTDRVLDEGIHVVIPFVNKIVKMDVTIQKEDRKASAASSDLQIVTSTVTINYRLEKNKVNKLYQKLRKDYSSRVIEPAIQEYIKKATAQFTAEELITKREEVKEMIKVALAENLAKNYIILEDIFITEFEFSETFDDAIENKVTAEQRALESKNKLEQVKYEAEQKVAAATAEAEAIRIQAQAITQQGGRDYVQLKAIEKWNGQLPAQMIPGGTVPFIDLSK